MCDGSQGAPAARTEGPGIVKYGARHTSIQPQTPTEDAMATGLCLLAYWWCSFRYEDTQGNKMLF